MRGCAPEDAASDWTAEHDPRITPFGGLLRRTHLDELPQVRQHPRATSRSSGRGPSSRTYVAELARQDPVLRPAPPRAPGPHRLGPGEVRYAGDEAETLEKLQYEFFYLRRQSLGLDLRIVGRTVRSVFGREGR